MAVPENIRVGSKVIQVTAVDSDAGSNSALRYVMSPSSSSSRWFSVNQHSGVISVRRTLDREHFAQMRFHVSLITYSSDYKYS